MTEKRCSMCGKIKDSDEFHKDQSKNDGLTSKCKDCAKAASRVWYAANPERAKVNKKAWESVNKDKSNALKKKWSIANQDKVKAANKAWYEANCERVNAASMAWQAANPDKVKASKKKWRVKNRHKCNEYRNKLREESPKLRLIHSVSSSINKSLKGAKQARHWETLVGYTIDDLKRHLEKQFKDGMSWENYGSWHVDHIIPMSAFNFSSPEHEDFKRCWALKNLRPLWAEENIRKSNKLDRHFQPSLAI